MSWFYLAIVNIQQEKTQISARTPEHWRNRKVIESMPLFNRWKRLNNFPEVQQCNNIADSFRNACNRSAVKKIAKRVGARTHPCLIQHLIGKQQDIEPSTWTVACMPSWNFRMMLSSVWGQPKHLMIGKKTTYWPRLKALVRCTNATYRAHCCLMYFSCCCLNESTTSMVEHDVWKPDL